MWNGPVKQVIWVSAIVSANMEGSVQSDRAAGSVIPNDTSGNPAGRAVQTYEVIERETSDR